MYELTYYVPYTMCSKTQHAYEWLNKGFSDALLKLSPPVLKEALLITYKHLKYVTMNLVALLMLILTF